MRRENIESDDNLDDEAREAERPGVDSLDERKVEQEAAAKTRELDLREREVTAREREVAAAWWRNPIMIGLTAAFVGFAANLVVTYLNNQNTLAVERQRSPSESSSASSEAEKLDGGARLTVMPRLSMLFDFNL